MSRFNYVLSRSENEELLTFFVEGSPYIVSGDHPSFDEILGLVEDGDLRAIDLVDVGKAISKSLKLSGRVTYEYNTLFFDGEPIHGTIVDVIVNAIREDDEDAVVPLVKFLEKLDANPSQNSREQLFNFVQANGISINEEGDLVLYKGVIQGDDSDTFLSVSSGAAIVNGNSHTNGRVPQSIGDVVEFPRHRVDEDSSMACSVGLHAGAWRYASTFSEVTLEVHVNPADVVSVPSDSGAQKVRVCRYKVISPVNIKYDSVIVNHNPSTEGFLYLSNDDTIGIDDWQEALDKWYDADDCDDFYDFLYGVYEWAYNGHNQEDINVFDRTNWVY